MPGALGPQESLRQFTLLALLCAALQVLLLRYTGIFSAQQSPTSIAMSPPPSAHDVASALLEPQGYRITGVEVLQSLWAGYGQICRVTVVSTQTPAAKTATKTQTSNPSASQEKNQSFILKLITPPSLKPKSGTQNEGHTRKILSYAVEQHFYTHLTPQLPPSIPIAKHIASMHEPHPDGSVSMATLLSDLKLTHPVAGEKRGALSRTQVRAALDWLGAFHGFWWPRTQGMDRASLVRPPLEEESEARGAGARETSVWLNGGYTYLATRRTEYADLEADEDSEWYCLTERGGKNGAERSIAELVAEALAPRDGRSAVDAYATLIHGDVKSENLFSSAAGDEVVFYDFQYVGLGLGVCDLAKLFTVSVPLDMLVSDRPVPRELAMEEGERSLLERYWARLQKESGKEYAWDIFVGHWEVALVDWLRFQASWGFWGNTEWLEARVRYILKDERWRDAVARMAGLSEG